MSGWIGDDCCDGMLLVLEEIKIYISQMSMSVKLTMEVVSRTVTILMDQELVPVVMDTPKEMMDTVVMVTYFISTTYYSDMSRYQ